MKTNKEKAREICGCEWLKQQGECLGENECHECSINNEYYHVMAMAKWKDEQYEWHKIADNDLPTKSGEYITVCKNKNIEDGIYLYEISYWTGNEWDNRKHYEDVVAWMELPKYEEE